MKIKLNINTLSLNVGWDDMAHCQPYVVRRRGPTNECIVVIKLINEMACFDKGGSITHSNNVAYFNNNYEILRRLGANESLVIEGGN